MDADGALLKQIEFYFSDSNYPKDKFLRAQASMDEKGFVKIDIIASFAKIKKLGVTDVPTIAALVKKSPHLEVNEDGTMIRRVAPLPTEDVSNMRTLYTKGWAKDATIEQVQDALKSYGTILSVRLRSGKGPNQEKVQKESIFVEFSTPEEAKKIAELKTIKVGDKEISLVTKQEYFEKKKEGRKAKKRANTDNNNNSDTPAYKKRKNDEEELVKGCILHITDLPESANKPKLQGILNPIFEGIRFVDFQKDTKECFVRFQSSDAATKAFDATKEKKVEVDGKETVAKLLDGEDESKYLEKVKNIMTQSKQNQQNFKKKKTFKRKRF